MWQSANIGTTGHHLKLRLFAHSFLATAMILLVAAAAACGATQDPTPTPQPAAETPGAAPTASSPEAIASTPPTGTAMTIPDWDLDETSKGQDLIDLLNPEEASCVKGKLGAGLQIFLSAPLSDQAPQDGGSGLSSAAGCFTEEHRAAANVAMLDIAAGGLSAATRRCVSDVLMDNPDAGLFPSSDEASDASAMLRGMACLTPGEAAALTPPDEGPPPDVTGLACLMEQLEGTASGERIIAVLSGADESGKGLTMDESAALGQAVEACGIETEFGFPDPTGTGASDDAAQTPGPEDIGGGSGLCTVGLILYSGDECSYGDFSMTIRGDGAAVLDGSIGGASMDSTVMQEQSIHLNQFSATRSGSTWTIESLP